MDEQQRERFGEAVEQKKREAKAASENPHSGDADPGSVGGDQQSLIEHGRPQDTRSTRKKNAGHGKKTADKWNQ
jgi:hypothetical protein